MNINKAIFLSIALLSTCGLVNAMAPRKIIKEETASEIRYSNHNTNLWVVYFPTTNSYRGNLPGTRALPMYMEIEPEEEGEARYMNVSPTATQEELRQFYNSLQRRYEQQTVEKG